jgi:mRNA interferase MazF
LKNPQRGEVWLVDLGLAAKVRPALVMSVPPGEEDRALVSIVPHTTSVRGSRFEASVTVNYLKAGVFDTQGIVTIPLAKLLRMLGKLKANELTAVESCLCEWLGLPCTSI